MSRAEAFLAGAVQIAGPLLRRQERIVAVKLHPDAVSVLQLHPTIDDWELDRLVSWSLENAIGRSPVQDNFSYLSSQISAAAEEAEVDGVDAGISIPHSLFDVRTLQLPYMEDSELADEAEEPEFWEEFDPELNNLMGKVVRHQILYSNEGEDRTDVMVASLPIGELERYRSLMLDANLVPVFVENELFSLVNGIYARMTTDERFKPFFVVHLCPGNNQIIAHFRGRLYMHKINISDFDEALMMELERVEEVEGDFWEEVAIRVSEQIKQAISFLVETYDVQRPDKIFMVSEYREIENFYFLLDERLGTTRVVIYDAMEDVDVPKEHQKYVDFFANPSIFTTAVGLATQGLNVEGRAHGDLHSRLVSMNFLEDAPRIRRNRQLAAVNRILSLAIVAVILFSGTVLGINTVPAYLQTREASAQYSAAEGAARAESLRRQVNEKKMTEINVIISDIRNNSASRGHGIFLSKLPELLPPGAELQNLEITEANGVKISGLALENADISRLKSNLRTAKLLRRDPAVETSKDGDYWRFSMTLTLSRMQ
ncbi:MAG: PilN domain-containing protein [Alphaproteobacteria bacterium]|nr:PilN domain-containing protein [Alphaproteobacteria bacterium]